MIGAQRCEEAVSEFESQTAEFKLFDSFRDGIARVEKRNCRVEVFITVTGRTCRCGGVGYGDGQAVDGIREVREGIRWWREKAREIEIRRVGMVVLVPLRRRHGVRS